MHGDLGSLPEYRIGIIGATSSGKSNLMITAVWQMLTDFGPSNDVEVSFGDAAEEKLFWQYVEWLKKGAVLQKTVSLPIPRAFTLSLRSDDGPGCLLYLYDAAGEDYQDEQRLAGHPLEKYDAILLVVDPFAEEGARRGLLGVNNPAEFQRANPAAIEATEILGRLINVLERILKVPVGGLFPLPIAVVVNKLDACGLIKRLRLSPAWMKGSHYTLGTAAYSAERYMSRIRGFLLSLGMGNFVRIIESRFGRVSYFPVSSLGRSFDATNAGPFKPFGVVAPLVWLCYQTDALSDIETVDRTFINFNVAFIRSLRGFQGNKARLLACGSVALLGLLIFIATQVLPLDLLVVAGGIQFVAVSMLYGCMFYQLVYRRYRD